MVYIGGEMIINTKQLEAIPVQNGMAEHEGILVNQYEDVNGDYRATFIDLEYTDEDGVKKSASLSFLLGQEQWSSHQPADEHRDCFELDATPEEMRLAREIESIYSDADLW